MKDIKKVITFKEFYNFKENTACLLFFRSRSNYFLVLSDMNNKCVFSCTTGTAKMGNNKKQKLTVHNIWKLVAFFSPYFTLYKIQFIKFYLRCRQSKHLFQLLSYLEVLKIQVKSFHKILELPHNGVRPRKLRRV